MTKASHIFTDFTGGNVTPPVLRKWKSFCVTVHLRSVCTGVQAGNQLNNSLKGIEQKWGTSNMLYVQY